MNGKLEHLFDMEYLKQLFEEHKEDFEEHEIYNEQDDSYAISTYSNGEFIESLDFGGCKMIINGKSRKVYPFGSHYLLWEKIDKQIKEIEDKVYILLDEYYNEVDNSGTDIICVCKSKEEVLARRKALVEANLNDDELGWVLDEETQDLEADLVRMFYGYQENWENYFNLVIEEKVVE